MEKITRRAFLKGAAAAVATVAIATKMAPKVPSGFLPVEREYVHADYGKSWIITRQHLEEYGYEALGKLYADALARSIYQMEINVAARVFWDNGYEALHVQGITAEEWYVDG